METLPRAVDRRLSWTLRSLRAVATLHLAAVLGQPVLAGMFLTGDVDAIDLHATIGSTLAAIGLLVIGAALAYVLVGRGPIWLLPAAVLLFLADGFQIGMGYERALEVHIPLGVVIVVGAVLLTGWLWSPAAARTGDAR